MGPNCRKNSSKSGFLIQVGRFPTNIFPSCRNSRFSFGFVSVCKSSRNWVSSTGDGGGGGGGGGDSLLDKRSFDAKAEPKEETLLATSD